MHVKFRSFEDLGEGKEWAVPPFRAVERQSSALVPEGLGIGEIPH
jgi:hypothetical protein